MSIKSVVRRLLPVSLRRKVKDLAGMPRWLHDDYYPLRCVGEIPEKHVVFDVGACHGWFTKCWLNYNPQVEAHCFEPTTLVFRDILNPALSDDNRVELVNAAVGSEKGSMELHTAEFHKANSFLKLSEDWAWSADDSIAFSDQETVDVITLADYIEQKDICAVKVIKIDVQGFEIEVLKGLDRYLDIVEYIYVETSIHGIYIKRLLIFVMYFLF